MSLLCIKQCAHARPYNTRLRQAVQVAQDGLEVFLRAKVVAFIRPFAARVCRGEPCVVKLIVCEEPYVQHILNEPI